MIIGSNIRNNNKIIMDESHFPVIFMHVGINESGENIDKVIDIEKKKILKGLLLGANVICDVSMSDKIEEIQIALMKDLSAPFGCVSIYETYIKIKQYSGKISKKWFLDILENECLRGCDILTLHATVFKDDDEIIKKSNRLIPTTSRGGILMLELMKKFQTENPYYLYFDEILLLCKRYEVCISLGPCYRPASVIDCQVEDDLHLVELNRMSVLCKKAILKNVGICIEGIGHAPLNKIEEVIKKSKVICYNVPYRVMAVSTDIALGYDHISSAIASANAIYYGADSITCVSRNEHIGIPTLEDTEEAVIAAKIAAYTGYSSRINQFERDYRMSLKRKNNGCLGDINSTLFPDRILQVYNNKKNKDISCTMCGEYCPLNKIK